MEDIDMGVAAEAQKILDNEAGPGTPKDPAIKLTSVDQIPDAERVHNINVDKLRSVDDKKIVEACKAMEAID
jgi:hypothetical protein